MTASLVVSSCHLTAPCASSRPLRAASPAPFRRQWTAALPRRLVPACATDNFSEDMGPPEFLEDLTRDFRGGNAEDDWQARKRRQEAERVSWRDGINFKPQSINAAARPAGFGDQIKEGIDKALIADFFFVCLSLLGLVLGVGAKWAFSSTVVLDLWLAAWPTIFQPAIGILMAGALLSGLYGWMQSDVMK